MRGELDGRDIAIATFQTELDNAKAEIEGKDNAIANLQNQISGVVAGNNDQVSTIANLETKLSGVISELKERDNAIAKLKTELEAREDKQLSLFSEPEPIAPPELIPEPEPEPENIESPAVNPEPLTVTPTEVVQTEIPLLDSIDGTVSVGGLMEHIREVKQKNPAFPDPPKKTQTFTDAVTGKTNRLGELERLYGFKLAGYVMKGQKREYRYKLS